MFKMSVIEYVLVPVGVYESLIKHNNPDTGKQEGSEKNKEADSESVESNSKLDIESDKIPSNYSASDDTDSLGVMQKLDPNLTSVPTSSKDKVPLVKKIKRKNKISRRKAEYEWLLFK